MLLDWLVPAVCLACGAPGRDLCAACRRQLPFLRDTCPRCGLPRPCERDGARTGGRGASSGACPAVGFAFSRAWAPVGHEGPAARLVHALKFARNLRAAREMAAQIAANAPPGLWGGGEAPGVQGGGDAPGAREAGRADASPGWVLVAAPAHPDRTRRRGFDQAEMLAAALARRTGLPHARGLLRRAGAETRQLGEGRAQRLAAGRIQTVARRPAPPLAVLVDDVHTTGATLDAAARALLDAGSRSVVCCTYARALVNAR